MSFIVIEGIDKAGKKTQGELLKNFLKKRGYEVTLVDYPDYKRPIGKIIFEYLHKKFSFPESCVWQLWALDQIQDKETIQNHQKNPEKIFLAIRFCHSNFAYQGANNIPLELMLQYYKQFELPAPDLVIFIDISPEESLKRKHMIENDMYEENLEFLRKVREKYLYLFKENFFAKEWVIVNGEKSIEEIAEEIQKIVLNRLEKNFS